MRALALLVIASSALFGGMNPAEIIRRSVDAAERGWKAQEAYHYTERDEENRLDSHGRVKSSEVDVSKIVFVNGSPLEEIVAHNGGAPTPAQKRKYEEELGKLKNETPAERAARLDKERASRAFIREVPDAFDFRLIGEQQIGGREAYVLEAKPHPGYRAHSKYGKIFPNVGGKLWVDEQDFGWIKVDATVTEPFSMGFFFARVQRGSHIVFEQTRVADGVWLPKRIEVRAEARVFFIRSYNTDETLSYSDYAPAQPSRVASSNRR